MKGMVPPSSSSVMTATTPWTGTFKIFEMRMTISGGRDFSSDMKSVFFHDKEHCEFWVTGEHWAAFAESDACHQNSAPGAEEEFAITFHAEQRAFYDVRRKSLSLKRFSHPAAGLLMQRWIAYDAAPANVLAAHFELRFYQHDPVGFTLCNRNQRGNEKANGYKTDVADNDVHRFADIFHRHIPRIGLFM